MSAETLHEAARQIRIDARVAFERGHISKRECDFKFAVSEWIEGHAGDLAMADGHLPSCDSPGDVQEALAVARIYLGEPA